MEIRGTGGVDGVGRVPGTGPSKPVNEPAKAAEGQPVDQVQISTEARLKALLAKVPDVREAEVNEIRDQIEAGTYVTEDKIDIAVDRLLDDLEA